MAYELVWEPDGVILTFSGKVSAREFIQSVENVQSDFRFDDTHYVINDFSAISSHELSTEVMTEAAVLRFGAYASNPNCRIVYVTTDEALALLSKLAPAEAGITSYQIEVCPTLSAARDWVASQPQLHLMSNVMGFRLDS
ncbi:MAG: hypothetical protein H6R14_2790 [Proteobacteria bacterium]|nr:hypothetical protein [Pseudomonadota bacterium]